MTAVMSAPAGGHFILPLAAPRMAPRSGILLNGSPSNSAPNSPKRFTPQLSPCSARPSTSGGLPHSSQSNNSSASSATSSTDDLVSSTSVTSVGDALSPSTSKGTGKASHSARKIRFAPLPETGRADYDDDDLLSPGFYTDVDSAQSSPRAFAGGLLSPPIPQVTPPTPPNNAGFGAAQAQSHEPCSILGLSLSGSSEPLDSGPPTETNTIVGSECGTDETFSATKKKAPKWARLLRLPKPAPLKNGLRSPDEGSNLSRCNSRESTVSLGSMRSGFFGWASLSDLNGSSTSLARRKSHGYSESVPNSPSARNSLLLKPVTSEHGTMCAPALRAKPRSGSMSQSGPVRRGTRLLNGRVYGQRRHAAFQQKNPFANVHDEPEFVEWGHGGMGSNRSVGGKANYSALQSSQKLSIGHVADGKGDPADDDDDGGGMGWVRRRREQREQERREKEERERKEKDAAEQAEEQSTVEVVGDGAAPDSQEAISEAEHAPAPPAETLEERKEVPKTESKADTPSASQAEIPIPSTPQKERLSEERKEREHVYTAVNIPAHRPHHHHHHSSQTHSLQTSPHQSALPTPTREHPYGSSTHVGPSPLGAEVGAVVVRPGEGSGVSPGSSASSSFEGDEEEEEDADESGDKDDEERDEEDEEELVCLPYYHLICLLTILFFPGESQDDRGRCPCREDLAT